MKKTAFICFCCLILTGCSDSPDSGNQTEAKYGNLDWKDAEISIPINTSYERLRFPVEQFETENGKQYLSEAYKGFFGAEPADGEWSATTTKIIDAKPKTVIVPLSELGSSELQYLIYRNQDSYMDIMRAFKLEGYRISETAKYAGDTAKYKMSWRPSFTGNHVKTVSSGNDVSYSLCGTDVSLSEAFATAKAFFERNDLGRAHSDLFTYQPVSAEVYRFENNNYGYTVSLDLLYDGVKISTAEGWSDEEANPCEILEFCGGYANVVGMAQQCFIGYPGRVDWFWSAGLNYPTCNDRTAYSVSDLLSKEDALEIVSKKMTADTKMKVSEIALEYMFCEVRNQKKDIPDLLIVEPSWTILLNVPTVNYNQIIFHISAVTGEVIIQYA